MCEIPDFAQITFDKEDASLLARSPVVLVELAELHLESAHLAAGMSMELTKRHHERRAEQLVKAARAIEAAYERG